MNCLRHLSFVAKYLHILHGIADLYKLLVISMFVAKYPHSSQGVDYKSNAYFNARYLLPEFSIQPTYSF